MSYTIYGLISFFIKNGPKNANIFNCIRYAPGVHFFTYVLQLTGVHRCRLLGPVHALHEHIEPI